MPSLLRYDTLVVNPLAVLAVLRWALGILTTALCANFVPVGVSATIALLHLTEVAALTCLAEILIELLVVDGFSLACYQSNLNAVCECDVETLSDCVKFLHNL